jgi:hypothetical protein
MGKTGGIASTERSGTPTRRRTRVAVMERADVRPAERGGSDPGEETFAVAAGAAIGAAADAEIAADVATEADSQASESAASAAISDAESVVADTAADVAHEASLVAHEAEVFATDVAARAATSLLSLDPMPVVDGTDPAPIDSASSPSPRLKQATELEESAAAQATATTAALAITQVAIAVAETAAAAAKAALETATLIKSELEREMAATALALLPTGDAELFWSEERSLPWPKEGGYQPSTRAALEPFIDAFEEAHARAFMDEPTFAMLVDKAHDHYLALQARNAVPLMFYNPTG